MKSSSWSSEDADMIKDEFQVWPLDEYNLELLNQVHPKSWSNENDDDNDDTVYDLVVIGAGAGGLVSSRQAARRGAKSIMISSELAGGDCLNVGCVPSKALIRVARMIREVQTAKNHPEEFGIRLSDDDIQIDFPTIMKRMRKLRAQIAPIDGHERGKDIGVRVLQGFGRFRDETTIEVVSGNGDQTTIVNTLKFKKAVIATGGRATIPNDIPGLHQVPYLTHVTLFNLSTLPKHMVVIGSGVIALEMAQTFATFGSKVTVLVRKNHLFPYSDPDIGQTLQSILSSPDSGNIEFITNAKVTQVQNLSNKDDDEDLPWIQVSVKTKNEAGEDDILDIQTDCLLVATGRTANVEALQLDKANVQYDKTQGVIVNDLAQSISNPNVYSVGDCTAKVPRLTHMSGEMAKVVVQNALFDDEWKLSSLVVPACMYTEPEYASVGDISGNTDTVDIYSATLEHNDRAILDGDTHGLVKIYCQKDSGLIVGAVVIANRAGEMINEITLAMKHNLTLQNIGRNIHCYPTTGEAIMSCGIQLINSKWKTL